MIDIINGKLILVPASGKLVPVDSVNANGWEATITAAFNRGLVKTRTITDVNYFYSDNPSQMPVACRTGTANASTINWNTTLARNVNMDAEVNVSNMNQAYTNGTLPITVQFVLQPAPGQPGGVYPFVGVPNELFAAMRTKSSPKSSAKVEVVNQSGQLDDPVMGRYSSTASTTHSAYGLKINSIEFGPGTNGSGPMLLASYRLVGPGYYIVRANSSTNVALNINTTNPDFFETNGNLITRLEGFLDSVVLSVNLQGSGRLDISNLNVFVPPENTYFWGLVSGGWEQQAWDSRKLNKDVNSQFVSTITVGKMWYQAGPSGIFSSPSNTR